MKYRFLVLCVVALLLISCDKLKIYWTAKKQPVASHSVLADQAEKLFWQTLHQGDYQHIAAADRLLTAAYLENPNDPKIAAHLGFLHIWKITERAREKTIPPTIVNEIILARKYFNDAVILDPSDARYLGFLGDSQLVEGTIFHDQREETRGYLTLQKAIKAWPEFNYFTAGYPMSNLPQQNKYFQQALAWQWNTLDLCAKQKVDRNNPDFSPYMKYETQTGPARACWNSWIAPYNFEGFFLNMGDMLVKSGDWQTAIKIYRNAFLANNYQTWPYKPELEKRIADVEHHIAVKNIMFNAGYGCAVCHKQGTTHDEN